VELIKPKDKITASSCYSLKTEAFDLDNTPSGSFRLNPNTVITPDTPKGVLGAMVASMSNNWESSNANYNQVPLGLYAKNSEGNAWENTPAIASGVVGIYMNGGTFLCYLFETHDVASPYAPKTLATAYAPGTLLYCSPYSLMGPDKPSNNGGGGGIDIAVALAAKTPTAVDRELGFKLLI
jgi:hypothetical protein